MTVLGSEDGKRPKTPTLQQWLLLHEKIPQKSVVVVVFPPNKIPNWTFVTEGEFRVNVHQSSRLFALLNESFHKWVEGGLILQVGINPDRSGAFTLELDEAGGCDWATETWGYRATEFRGKPTATQKAIRAKQG